MALAELTYGAENSSDPRKNLNLIDKFSEQVKILPIFNAIQLCAKEKTRLRKSGTLISDFDLLIASTRVSNGLIMVTENIKEFARISDIKIENWVKR